MAEEFWKNYKITGIQAGAGTDGSIPIRREIDEWWFSNDKNDVNQKSLFILATINFQKRDLMDVREGGKGYLSVAGIHGWPTPYCHHAKYTFNTWHTPYMLLLEQRIYEEMTELIPHEYLAEDQDEMMKAANTWRFPFWDWAMKKPDWDDSNPEAPVNFIPGVGPNVPYLITQRKVPVRTKMGEVVMIDNPWWQFKTPEPLGKYGIFGAVEDKPDQWVSEAKATSRRPKMKAKDFSEWKNGYWTRMSAEEKDSYINGTYQDFHEITHQLRGSVSDKIEDPGDKKRTRLDFYANSLPEGVYRLYASVDDQGNPVAPYPQFASSVYHYKDQTNAYPSMEGLHNVMHDFVGGMGFMSGPFTSSFEPLFWFFHAQCDRLLAIWQELFKPEYERWLNGGKGSNDSSGKGPDSNLPPFRGADSKFFTSKTCSYKHKEFNYTYPELQRWKYDDEASFHAAIREDLERLYSTTSKTALTLGPIRQIMKVQMEAMTSKNLAVEYFPPQLVAMATEVEASTFSTQDETDYGKPPNQTWQHNDYVISVVYERFALDGHAYSITFFLGDVPVRTSSDGEATQFGDYNFKTDQSAISKVYNFVSPLEDDAEVACENCKQQAEEKLLVRGTVILTDYLIEKITQQVELRGLKLQTLDEDEVVSYLKKNLHWRVTDAFGEIILKEKVPSLKIFVEMGTATHHSSASKPSTYGKYKTLWDVTQGRLGGAGPDDL